MIREHESVVLDDDLPEKGLKHGDIGTVVMVHRKKRAYEVEFMTLHGDTVAVVTLLPSQVRSVGAREIARVRTVSVV
jgi:hypothetical protein